MSAVVTELIGVSASMTADNQGEISRRYSVTGVSTEVAAVTAVRNFLLLTLGPTFAIGSLVLDKIQATEEDGQYIATANWRTFARRSQPAMGESQFNFEMSLDPVRVKIPVGGITVFKASSAETWAPQLINDLGNGEDPEGIDVYEPVYEESETHWGPTAALTPAYRNLLKSCVGKVNASAFKGWQPGEVLLRGITGTRRGANDSELTFRWSVRENQSALTVGTVTGINKQGWQYLWPRYSTVRQSEAPAIQAITHVCVATVFRTAEFSSLGIGV